MRHPNQPNVRYFRSKRRALTKADYYGNDKHIGHVSTNGQCTNGWNGQRHALYRLPGPVNNWNVPQKDRAALWARYSRLASICLPTAIVSDHHCDSSWVGRRGVNGQWAVKQETSVVRRLLCFFLFFCSLRFACEFLVPSLGLLSRFPTYSPSVDQPWL